MKKIKQFFNWLVSLIESNQKTPPHEHQFEKFFNFEDGKQKTTFYRCVGCGEQKTEVL